jgi:hypothetical protein
MAHRRILMQIAESGAKVEVTTEPDAPSFCAQTCL